MSASYNFNMSLNNMPVSPNFNVCRVCLALDTKVVPIIKLEMAFEELTGISIDEDSLPKVLCVECAQRVRNFFKFKNKCHNAFLTLMELIEKNEDGQLTRESIKSLDRKQSELASNLEIKIFEPDHYDCTINYENPEETIDTEIKIEKVAVLEPFSVKIESEIINVNEVKDDDSSDNDFPEFIDDKVTVETLPLQERVRKKGPTKKRTVKKAAKKELPKKDEVKPVKTPKKAKEKKEAKPKVEKVAKTKPDKAKRNPEAISLFTVTKLSNEERIAEIQKRQECARYVNSLFKCTICYLGFKVEDAYDTHMTRHTDACGTYVCQYCKMHFKSVKLRRDHISQHHTRRYSCNECTYVVRNRIAAVIHQKWHKGTKYTCAHCGNVFNKFSSYSNHVRVVHPSDFVCELCGYSYVSEKGKEQHKKLTHRLDNTEIPEDGPYCDQCNVRFISEEALQRHLSVSPKHTTDKSQKQRNTGRLVKKPTPRFGGQLPCEQCGLQLSTLKEYNSHFRKMHKDKTRTFYPANNKSAMCDVCGKLFQSVAHLKEHAFVHSGKKPYKCDICGRVSSSKTNLSIHMNVHSATRKTYPCAQCGKHFTTDASRTRHLLVHTDLRPFKCEMCEKYFKSVSEKQAHVNYVHLKKPWPKRTGKGRRVVSSGENEIENMMDYKPIF